MAFKNPYQGCVKQGISIRLNADVLADRYNFYRSIRLANGTIQTTVNLLLEKLYHECIRRGITNASNQSEFERFVTDSQLVLPDEVFRPKQ